MLNWTRKLFAVGAILLGSVTTAWGEMILQDEEPAPPVLIVPTEESRQGREIQLELFPDRWNGKSKTVSAADALSVSAVGRLGERGRTFAKWRRQDESDTVEAGLECSLFGPDRWKVTHKVRPTDETQSDSTKLSLGLDVSQAAKLSVSGTTSDEFTELGSGISYKTESGLEWGATLKARRQVGGEEGKLWHQPAIESRLRWTW